MNNLIWLLRASKWARNPPDARAVRLVLAIMAVAVMIVVIEKLGFWPDWARVERGRGVRVPH